MPVYNTSANGVGVGGARRKAVHVRSATQLENSRIEDGVEALARVQKSVLSSPTLAPPGS